MTGLQGEEKQILLAAVDDAQQVIRALDVKAEILAAFAAVIGAGIHSAIDTSFPVPGVLGSLAIALMLVTVICLGVVVFPRSAPPVDLGGYVPHYTFYLPSQGRTPLNVTAVLQRAQKTDWKCELAYELLKLSLIRDRKTWWFKLGLIVAAIATSIAAAALIWERIQT
jgi:hypothetical protein